MHLLLECRECKAHFSVGIDATIEDMPGDQSLRIAASTIGRGQLTDDERSRFLEEPHYVYHVDCQTLSPYQKQWLEFVIDDVKTAVSSGERRRWRCGRCGAVQPYSAV